MWFRVAATAVVALRGVCPTGRASAAMIRRDRNQVKYDKWHFYLLLDLGCARMTETINKLKETVEASTGRNPGGSNEPLKMERPTAKTVEIT